MTSHKTWIHGVTQPLPEGEELLWQGTTDWKALARHALHVRLVAGYFAVIIGAGLVGALQEGLTLRQVMVTLGTQLALSGIVVGGVLGYAWLTAKNTVYAITSRRVVMKVGIVLPTTINIPLHLVDGAAAGEFRDGTGQIALALRPPDRLAYAHLWPHARGWHLRHPQPTLRGLTGTRAVAAIIRQAAESGGPIASPVAGPANATTPSSMRPPVFTTEPEGALQ